MAQHLPSDLTGEKPVRFTYERTSDAFGFNRVQGYALGAGIGIRLPWWNFTNLYGTARYGFSDETVTGRLGVVRNGPGWKLTVDGYYDIVDQDPISPGRNLVNSFNAIFTAHDNADYMLGGGGSANLNVPLSDRLDLRVGAKVEWEGTVVTETGSGVNDFLGGIGRDARERAGDGGNVRRRLGGTAPERAGGMDADRGCARWGRDGHRSRLGRPPAERGQSRRALRLRVKTGIATSPVLPQMEFRAGGINTVRGYQYGTQRGAAFWSAQADVTPFAGPVRPVLFMDAGWAGSASDYFGGIAARGRRHRAFDLQQALPHRHHPLRPEPRAYAAGYAGQLGVPVRRHPDGGAVSSAPALRVPRGGGARCGGMPGRGRGDTARAVGEHATRRCGTGDLALPLKAAWCESRGRLTLLGRVG